MPVPSSLGRNFCETNAKLYRAGRQSLSWGRESRALGGCAHPRPLFRHRARRRRRVGHDGSARGRSSYRTRVDVDGSPHTVLYELSILYSGHKRGKCYYSCDFMGDYISRPTPREATDGYPSKRCEVADNRFPQVRCIHPLSLPPPFDGPVPTSVIATEDRPVPRRRECPT